MRKLLHKQEKGHLGQYEDWWYLVQSDGQEPYVEHEWDHVSVGSGDHRQGTDKMSVDQALEKAPYAASEALRKLLSS